MATVTTPVSGFNGVVAGQHFNDGVAVDVTDPQALQYFTSAGYKVEDGAPLDLSKLTVAELHELAEARGIELAEGLKKAEVVEALSGS